MSNNKKNKNKNKNKNNSKKEEPLKAEREELGEEQDKKTVLNENGVSSDVKNEEKKGPFAHRNPRVLFFIGSQCSGKQTHAQKLSEELKVPHLSVDSLRKSDEDVASKLVAAVKQNDKTIVTGFPSSAAELEEWKKLSENVGVVRVILLEIPRSTFEKRSRQKRDGDDDNIDDAKKKYFKWNEDIKPVLDHYQTAHLLSKVWTHQEFDLVHPQIQKIADLSFYKQIVFLLGGPGSGKGTQSQRLEKNYRLKHFAAGDLLRSTNDPEVRRIIDEGKIVPVETTLGLLKRAMDEHISKHESNSRLFIIDGFPRNEDNLSLWQKVMPIESRVRFMLWLDCSLEVCKKRLLGRNQGRSDDNEKTIANRITTYLQSTEPIGRKFEEKELLEKVDSEKDVDEVEKQIKSVIERKFTHSLHFEVNITLGIGNDLSKIPEPNPPFFFNLPLTTTLQQFKDVLLEELRAHDVAIWKDYKADDLQLSGCLPVKNEALISSLLLKNKYAFFMFRPKNGGLKAQMAQIVAQHLYDFQIPLAWDEVCEEVLDTLKEDAQEKTKENKDK